ncbi:hypothetical protein V2J09_001561 [Rumex salicifolius]
MRRVWLFLPLLVSLLKLKILIPQSLEESKWYNRIHKSPHQGSSHDHHHHHGGRKTMDIEEDDDIEAFSVFDGRGELEMDSVSKNAMIAACCREGKLQMSLDLFWDKPELNDTISWNTIIAGFEQHGHYKESVELFTTMVENGVRLNEHTFASILGACSGVKSLRLGKEVHARILKDGLCENPYISSGIVDVYSKCHRMDYAELMNRMSGSLFHGVSNKDSVLYNVMIAGYAHNALENKAIDLFNEMIEKGTRPEPVTFIALLSACRHAGFVELGEKYFHSMEKDYGISPEIDHYSCMVDLYGRANMLEKALSFIREIPIQPDAVIWGSFLNACKINGKMELAREAEDDLMRIEGNAASRYVQIANLYAAEETKKAQELG